MSDNGKEVAVLEKTQSLTVGKAFSLTPTNLKEAMDLAKMISDSDLAPKDFRGKAGNCLIAMQMGMEVGLAPMQAIQNIAVINGRPTLWGDAALGLVLASPVCEYVREEWDEKAQTWTVRSKRRDDTAEKVSTFSMADATKAGLAKKDGTWQSYPKRMIQMRARAFNLRDNFADVLKGLAVREEVEDYVETSGVDVPPVAIPKAKVPDVVAGQPSTPLRDLGDIISPQQRNYLQRKLAEVGADETEVARFIQDSFKKNDIADLTTAEASTVLRTWHGEPSEAAK